ncbi:MAG: hypothetical protein KME29_06980 [Calothrix sp. FI2-JRJ7]|nr:hypothetical protein [Calothrix sp. FI2-JRJ7]
MSLKFGRLNEPQSTLHSAKKEADGANKHNDNSVIVELCSSRAFCFLVIIMSHPRARE